MGYKLLIADDEPLVRTGLAVQTDWAALGFSQVYQAANGLEALEIARREKPDLIVSDIRMPKMSGLEMLRILRGEQNGTEVIFLTAYSEFTYAREALKLYAFDYLLKPFEDGELEAAVTRALERIAAKQDTGRFAEPDGKPGADSVSLLPFDGQTPGLSAYVRAAVCYMSAHCSESSLNVACIAAAVGISEGHLSHCFKKETGYTVTAWLTRCRMQKAVELLSDCRNRVNEVAEMVGYRDFAYFSAVFKKIVGVPPSEIAGKNRNG